MLYFLTFPVWLVLTSNTRSWAVGVENYIWNNQGNETEEHQMGEKVRRDVIMGGCWN